MITGTKFTSRNVSDFDVTREKKVYRQRLLCSKKILFHRYSIMISREETTTKCIKSSSFVRTKQTKRLDPVKAVSLMKFMSLDYIRVNKDSVYKYTRMERFLIERPTRIAACLS